MKLLASIIPDLRSLKSYQLAFLMLFGAVMIVFSVIDFNYLLGNENRPYLTRWENDTYFEYETWRKVIMTFSGVASFTGAFCVVLVSVGKFSQYFWGILNCIFYGTFAFAYGYAGDAQLNIFFFLPLQFVGIYYWKDNADEDDFIKVRKLTLRHGLLVLVMLAVLIPFFYWEIPAFSIALTDIYFYEGNTAALWLDVLTNSFSVTAQTLLSLRFREHWFLWICVNCMQIAMFSGIGGFGIDFNVLCMWSLFLVNSLYGCYMWHSRPLDGADSKIKQPDNDNDPEESSSSSASFTGVQQV